MCQDVVFGAANETAGPVCTPELLSQCTSGNLGSPLIAVAAGVWTPKAAFVFRWGPVDSRAAFSSVCHIEANHGES
jgi:hypothetical protein